MPAFLRSYMNTAAGDQCDHTSHTSWITLRNQRCKAVHSSTDHSQLVAYICVLSDQGLGTSLQPVWQLGCLHSTFLYSCWFLYSCGLWVLHEACHCTQRCQFRSTIRACWTAYVVFVDVCSAADVPAKHYTTQGSANSVCDNSHFCSHMQNIHYGFLPCNASDRLICKPLALSACKTNK